MSIILSGLINVFQPLLTNLSVALDCEGLTPWYFLLGLRIVAIFFCSGPWDTIQEDIACNWIHPMQDWSQDFCTALCHNQHFPISISATWGLVFTVLLLLVGLMRLSIPKKKKDDHKDDSDTDKDKDKLAIVAMAPHRSSADISTIYMVGPRGLTRNFGSRSSHSNRSSRYRPPDFPYRAPWGDWNEPPVAYWPREPDPNVQYGPSEIEGYGGYGGYGMPVYSSPIGETRMPDQSYNMAQRKMTVWPMDSNQTKSTMNCPGTNQYGLSILNNQIRQTDVAPPYDETAQFMPTKCAPIPVNSSSCKGYAHPQCWQCNEHNEAIQQRYIDPAECGIQEPKDSSSTDCMYSMCTPNRYAGQSKTTPKYCEGDSSSMATKCKPGIKSDTGSIAVPPWQDDKANVAIKRRPVTHGNKMPTKRHVTFDATSSNGANVYSQPWMAGSSPMPGDGACGETNPCSMDTSCGPQCGCGEATSTSVNTSPNESIPGPQDEAKMTISRICGIPLFDLWVGLILGTEIGFLLAIVLLQMPRLVGRTWICVSGATSCPPSVQCALRGRAEKRVALWGLAFTSILFIIGCSAYFNLRMCWNNRCRRTCRKKKDEGEEDCTTAPEPEGRVFTGDVECGNE